MYRIWFLLLALLYFPSCQNKQDGYGVQVSKKRQVVHPEFTTVGTIPDTAEVNKIIRAANTIVKKKPDRAIPLYLKAVSLCKKMDYPEGLASAYNNLSYCYWAKKDYPMMNHTTAQLKIVLLKVPSPYYNEKHHKIFLGSKYINAAASFFASGHYDSASTLYVKIIALLTPPDSITYGTLATAYMGLGAASGRLANINRAFSYFSIAERLAHEYKDSSLWVNILSDKASLLTDEKKYDEAKIAALSAMEIAKRIGNTDIMAMLANTIAISLLKEQKPQEALPYSKMVLESALQKHSDEEMISANYILGYNYVRLGQYKIAEDYLLSGLRLALPRKSLDNIANAYGQLASAYEGQGRYKEAIVYKNKYMMIRDSLLGRESAGRIAEIETRYRVAQKDNELVRKDKILLQNQLKNASQQKRQYLGIGVALVCILILLGLLLQKHYRIKLTRLKATIAGEEKERRRFAQELHDGIVNKLSIIKMNFSSLPMQYDDLTEAADFNGAVDQLEQSIMELRTTSHNLLPEILQKAGLAESVKIYCEKINKVALLEIEFQLIGELPALTDEFQLNIYRIIQELVNNIIKHSSATHALVQFQAKSDWLNITIDDNGNGVQGISPKKGEGIGLQNLQDRIQLMNGRMEIENGKGTSVYLTFNLKKFIRKS